MGFDFELYEPDDESYGSMQEDGTWNGMVQDLIKEVSFLFLFLLGGGVVLFILGLQLGY